MSDNDSSDEAAETYIFYRDRPEWNDVSPIGQDDGPDPVVRISYSKKFSDVYDYFRGVMQTGEKSLRVLQLTADALNLNAANYTVWQYRRDTLLALKIPSLITSDGIPPQFTHEFAFSTTMIEDNQKNYQVWHHRKSLVMWLVGFDEETGEMQLKDEDCRQQVVRQELELTEVLLAKDGKNYHAWQHRQWVLGVFRAFSSELNYVNFLIEEDVRNNSAWNQRYYVIKNSPDIQLTEELVRSEVDYTWSQILKAPSNESPWNYLRGVYELSDQVRVEDDPVILSNCLDLVKSGSKSVHLRSFLLYIYEEKLDKKKGGESEYQNAMEICSHLDEHDKIRSSYWQYMKNTFVNKFGGEFGSATATGDQMQT